MLPILEDFRFYLQICLLRIHYCCLSAPCGVSCVPKLRTTSVRSSIDMIRLYSSVPARVLPVS